MYRDVVMQANRRTNASRHTNAAVMQALQDLDLFIDDDDLQDALASEGIEDGDAVDLQASLLGRMACFRLVSLMTCLFF